MTNMNDETKQKKIAAAIGGVMEYLAAERASAADRTAYAGPPPFVPWAHINHWGQSGRQSMMQTRTMMQLRSFRSTPPR